MSQAVSPSSGPSGHLLPAGEGESVRSFGRRFIGRGVIIALPFFLLSLPLLKAVLMWGAGLELHFDEAQYWEWSRRLDGSYYSKGPLVAWLIALSETLLGHGAWQVRLPAWLAYSGFLALLFYFAHQVWNSRAASGWVLLLGLTTPLFFTLGSVMTTDILLLLLWTWGLWAAWRALFRGRPLAWYEFGAAAGLGGLTKLSIVLLPVFVGGWLLLTRAGREQLKTPHPWLAALLALVLFSPVVLWNAQHDWVMFRHELGHVAHDEWSLNSLLDFSLTQIFALSPLVVLAAASVLWRKPASEQQRFLWYSSLFLLGFFLIKAFSAKVQLNWAAPSYIGFLILFAGQLPNLARVKRAFVYVGVFISLTMIAIGHFPYSFGLASQQDPFRKMRAWQAPVATVQIALEEAGKPIEFILTDSYTLAGELAFYWPTPMPVYITGNATRRYNQHDLWPGIEREAGRNGAYISTSTEPPPELLRAFTHCVLLPPVTAYAPDGAVLRTLYARHCTDYQPITWPRPSRY